MSAWNGFIDCEFPHRADAALSATAADCGILTAFFLTAHFSQEDYPYDWCVAVSLRATL